MDNQELERILNKKLNVHKIKDFCPNGLQVEGKKNVKRIVTGVTASQALIEFATEKNADAILVHHGYFWKGENQQIRGMKGRRITNLIKNDINLYAYHLPLDIHPKLGNNRQIADMLHVEHLQPLEDEPISVPVWGELQHEVPINEFIQRIESCLDKKVLHCSSDNAPKTIKKVGICTGGGQGYIDLAAQKGMDIYITGEVSEQTVHSAREQGIHFVAAGHHATERYGVKKLGEWLAENYDLEVIYKDIDNPA